MELVQGTLDMLILNAVSLGGLHGFGDLRVKVALTIETAIVEATSPQRR